MKLGIFKTGWWDPAARARGLDVLPLEGGKAGNPYQADLAARLAAGQDLLNQCTSAPPGLMVDNGGAGLLFVPGLDGVSDIRPAHEVAGIALASHFIDPVCTALQGLDWPVTWQCLQSESWIKAVWDIAQANELRRFGVPGVMHLPMAAANRAYPIEPIDPANQRPVASFVGGQNTSFFQAQNVPGPPLFVGTLAHAVRNDLPRFCFYEIYHDLYRLGDPIAPDDPLPARFEKTAAYFNAKVYFNAAQCVRNRDRYAIFLQKQMPDRFELIGPGWDRTYGLKTGPPFPTNDAYLQHFRDVAINLNFVNGNAETGLNMRHYEITAAGGFMLCHEHPELGAQFEVGKECVTFRNESDLLEKIDHYLQHPDERRAIAAAGQQRTLCEHLYSHRLQRLLETVAPPKPPVTFATSSPWEDIVQAVGHPEVVLDCGANIGQTAETFRKLFPSADIYSFEPVGALFEKLESRCAQLGVRPVKKAVADRDGHGTIHLTASPESNSLLDFQDHNPAHKYTRIVGQEQVDLCTLDRWCDENKIDPKRIGLIKMDIQGAELKALKGAGRVLQSAKAVFLEVSFVTLYRECPLYAEVDSFLRARGFRCQAVYPSDQPHNWADALYVKD